MCVSITYLNAGAFGIVLRLFDLLARYFSFQLAFRAYHLNSLQACPYLGMYTYVYMCVLT